MRLVGVEVGCYRPVCTVSLVGEYSEVSRSSSGLLQTRLHGHELEILGSLSHQPRGVGSSVVILPCTVRVFAGVCGVGRSGSRQSVSGSGSRQSVCKSVSQSGSRQSVSQSVSQAVVSQSVSQ